MKFIYNLNRPKGFLLLANLLLVFFLILLNNFGIIPLETSDFIFFAILALAFALYRPGWVFLFFTGTIILENINLAPLEWGITIRPFQLLGAAIAVALILRLIFRRINFKLAKLKWPDYSLIVLILAGFLSALGSPDKIYSLKLSLILATFGVIYFLVRNYIQNLEDLKKIIPFFLSSSVIVVLYGIWQNWRFMRGLISFEAMPGRPNTTFTEADWLGIFLVLAISIIYTIVYFRHSNTALAEEESYSNYGTRSFSRKSEIRMTIIYLFLILNYILLILTVSRSAWMGMAFVTILFLFIALTNLKFRNWQWKRFFYSSTGILFSLAVSLATVYIFHLTNFQLFNRVQSTGTGMQKITVSCKEDKKLPEAVGAINELEELDCRHINLEEIQSEIENGRFVKEIYRADPNVSIRSEIYQKSWEQIKAHPILGIGWGSIGSVLGTDERGVRLNSSNIFLETWLGAGIIGLLAFLAVWVYIIISAVKKFTVAEDASQKAFSLFLILAWLGLSAVNLFNAGLFLGFFWFFLALAVMLS